MIKVFGFVMIILAAIMLIPATSASVQSDLPKMYGIATIVLKDSTGGILFENVMFVVIGIEIIAVCHR